MLKVYGMTYDHTTNYGSCLQAYALKTAIEKIEVGGKEKCDYRVIPIKACKDWPIPLRTRFVKPLLNLHRKQFIPFEKEYMKFASCMSINEFYKLNKEADAFVCGSDVIWNPDFNFNISAFYLDFSDKYNFSYAASFGKKDINKSTYTDLAEKLKHLNEISVRDKSSADIVQSCIGQAPYIAIDPVLLLSADEWNLVADQKDSCKPYIFIYATHLNDTYKKFISLLKEKTGYPVITSVWGPKQALKQGVLQVHTPQRWLQLLRDAEYVVTNSFHATAFSTIYHKTFFTVVHGDKSKGTNMRMNEFLKDLGLQDRIFSDIPADLNLSEINYDVADLKMIKLRNDSVEFLTRNLETAYQQKMRTY